MSRRLKHGDRVSVLGQDVMFKNFIYEYGHAFGVRISIPHDPKMLAFLAVVPIEWLDNRDEYDLRDPIFDGM